MSIQSFYISRYLSNLFPIQITVQSFYLSRCIPNLFGMGLLPARDFHDFARCSSIYSCYMSNKLFQNIYNLILDKIYFQRFWHCIWDMKNTVLTKRQYFHEKCSIFPRMLYFLFSMLEKEKQSIFYIQGFWFLHWFFFCITTIYVYNIYIYIYI